MDAYRIKFFTTKPTNSEHEDVNLDTADHFHVYKNNKKIGEQTKLYLAVKIIIYDFGKNRELESLMRNSYFLQKFDPIYQCIGINFSEKHGIKIEMKLRR